MECGIIGKTFEIKKYQEVEFNAIILDKCISAYGYNGGGSTTKYLVKNIITGEITTCNPYDIKRQIN